MPTGQQSKVWECAAEVVHSVTNRPAPPPPRHEIFTHMYSTYTLTPSPPTPPQLDAEVYTCRDSAEVLVQSCEGPASPSCAHDSPGRHSIPMRSPVRRPARNVLFASPQNVSSD